MEKVIEHINETFIQTNGHNSTYVFCLFYSKMLNSAESFYLMCFVIKFPCFTKCKTTVIANGSPGLNLLWGYPKKQVLATMLCNRRVQSHSNHCIPCGYDLISLLTLHCSLDNLRSISGTSHKTLWDECRGSETIPLSCCMCHTTVACTKYSVGDCFVIGAGYPTDTSELWWLLHSAVRRRT